MLSASEVHQAISPGVEASLPELRQPGDGRNPTHYDNPIPQGQPLNVHRLNFSLAVLFQKFLHFHGGHAAGARSRYGLPVAPVLHVAAGEHPVNPS